MKLARAISMLLLALIVIVGLAAPLFAPYKYDQQFRESIASPPSKRFLIGTDDVGRDRLSRLIYATRISVLLVPAAALLSVALGLGISLVGPRWLISGLTTLFLSLPWIFAFIVMRSELPLNTSPAVSVMLTFALMGFAGWAYPARVFSGSLRQIEQSDWLLCCRASGMPFLRIAGRCIWPHLRSVAVAQFRVLIPAYILSEASLGLLGLGVAEPLPSWGTMLLELRRPDLVQANPWLLTPLCLLMVVMVCLEILDATPRKATAGEITS